MRLSIRLLFTLSVLAFVSIGCVKSSDIEDLQEQIDAMKSEQSKSIEPQIESVRKSITSLEGLDKALQEYIKDLQNQIILLRNSEEAHRDEIETLQKAVETLQEKDKDLQEQINALKEYVDSLISDTKKWANATFATIEQYNSISEIIADIQAQIETINIKITSYDTLITSINNSISSMKLDIETLQKQMTAILAQIQSIKYVPQYSDGKAVMFFSYDEDTIVGGDAILDFEVKPASAAKEIATVWSAESSVLSIKAVYTITKTPLIVDLAIESVAAEDGYLTVTVSGKALKDDFFRCKRSASVRLGITDGNNDIASEYIQIIPRQKDLSHFEDPKFQAYCINNFDANGDGILTEEETQVVTRIECANCDISSLSEIAYFCNLEYIDVSCNRLTSLNLSQNLNLKAVKANNNKLQTLDLTSLSALITLDCSYNELSRIDVSDNVKLDTLACSANKITSLDVSNNAKLTYLDVSSTSLTVLDVSGKAHLSNLDVSNNQNLTTLDVSLSSLASLDVSSNTALTNLNVNGSLLGSLKILDQMGCLIGQYVVADGVKGVIFSVISSVVKVVSTTETRASWGYYGITTGAGGSDGAASTDKIVSESPAAQWCRSLGAEWYLPTEDELRNIYRNKGTLNKTLLAIGGTELGNGGYWSSYETNRNWADYVDYSWYGNVCYADKDDSNYVRAVRKL